MPFLKQVTIIEEAATPLPPKEFTETLINELCQIFSVEPAVVRGHTRKRHISRIRWIIAYLLRELDSRYYTYQLIAELLNQHYSTIMSGLSSLENIVQQEPSYHQLLAELLAYAKRRKEGKQAKPPVFPRDFHLP